MTMERHCDRMVARAAPRMPIAGMGSRSRSNGARAPCSQDGVWARSRTRKPAPPKIMTGSSRTLTHMPRMVMAEAMLGRPAAMSRWLPGMERPTVMQPRNQMPM